MSLPMRAAQALVDTLWRATTRAPANEKALNTLQSVPGSGGWWPVIREPYSGAYQRNVSLNVDSVLSYSTVFSVVSLITSDVSKLRLRLVFQGADGIWREVENPAFSPVLRKPNRYQTRIQFMASWVESKLIHGNTYVLKQRDNRNVVTGLYVLNPELVSVLVAPDGAIYYELRSDNLAGVPDRSATAPASEIIHDRWNTLWHPLVGMSPLRACGLAATQGLKIQENSVQFFANGSNPGGIVSVPTEISKEKALALKQIWDETYGSGGSAMGTVAVLSGGMSYIPMRINAADAQLLEQLKWTAETVCSVFHVPAHMVGIGQAPTYNNIESLNQQYYSQCLQKLLEDIEVLLDEGLGLGDGFGNDYGTEFDLDGLLRMDTSTKVKAASEAVKSGCLAPDEARMRYFDLGPVEGGGTPYLQIQNYSLSALHRRDQQSAPVTPGPTGGQPKPTIEESADDGGSNEARSAYRGDILRRSRSHYVSRSA